MFSTLRAKLLVGIALVAIAIGGSLLATREGGSGVAVGPLAVDPAVLHFAPGKAELTLRVTNTSAAAAPFRLVAGDPWLTASPGEATLSASATQVVTVRADLAALSEPAESRLRVVSGGESGVVRVIATIGPVPAATGRARLDVASSVDLGGERLEAAVLLANRGGELLTWRGRAGADWLAVGPAKGSIEPGATQTVRVTVDRAGLDPGAYGSALTITSNGGEAEVAVRMRVGDGPVLGLSRRSIDFGVADQGKKTKTFRVRNVGRETLRWSAAPGAPFVELPGATAGTLPPGGSHEVKVRWNFDQAVLGRLESVVDVTSDGGDGSVAVSGTTDPTSPEARDLDMGATHEHCEDDECFRFRHARARIVEPYSEVASVEVEWRFCLTTGPPGANPSCDQWRFVDMERVEGETWQAEIGPLQSCFPNQAAVINYRIHTQDSLGNRGVYPGNSTFQVKTHCDR